MEFVPLQGGGLTLNMFCQIGVMTHVSRAAQANEPPTNKEYDFVCILAPGTVLVGEAAYAYGVVG